MRTPGRRNPQTGLRRAALFASLAGALVTPHAQAQQSETYRVTRDGEMLRLVLPHGHQTEGHSNEDAGAAQYGPAVEDPTGAEPNAPDHSDSTELGWSVDDALE